MLRLFHQTGEKDLEWTQKQYRHIGFENAEVSAYFFDIFKYFEKSDLIVCRAGATTIAEIIASQKPSILVPFPHSAENHQLLNARELERIKGAEVILEKDFTPQRFSSKIKDFIINQHKLDLMSQKLQQIKTENPAEQIADLCVELMNKPKEAAN
jgi:UDP-N-acetylglucosamine--N-acetylmuramyl-(pentapeptide) pyrophosphoryl-undecaprenol N-acetylglucosamine transferase